MRIFLLFCICAINFLWADDADLQSKNVEVRTAAILKIGQVHSTENFQVLYKHFAKMNIMEKKAYMQVLGKWEGDDRGKAMAILANTLLSRDSREVKRESALGLGEMAHADQSMEDKDAQERLKQIVTSLKKGLVNTSDSYQVREDIIAAFGKIGNVEHINVLAIGLKDRYPSVRTKAAEMFEQLGASAHVDILIKHYLKETAVSVQRQTVEVLTNINKQEAFPLFEKILLDRRSDNQIRQRMAEILGDYSSEEFEDVHEKAIKALAKSFINEKDQTLRINIIKSLAKFDTSSTEIKNIYKLAKKDKQAVREVAEELLGK